jgi:uncharacterized tellurite resistance protein B-like protein
MLDQILKLMGGDWQPESETRDDLQVAVAALLVEAAWMDEHFEPIERATIESLLTQRFGLTGPALRRLMDAAERAHAESAQLFRFTHRIVEEMGPDQRIQVIEMLWETVYADGVLNPDEDTLVRRVAGLIYVSDRDRGEARRRVLTRLGFAS